MTRVPFSSPAEMGVAIAGANVPDQKLVAETLDSIPVQRPEPTSDEPHHLCLDKGYVGEAVERQGIRQSFSATPACCKSFKSFR